MWGSQDMAQALRGKPWLGFKYEFLRYTSIQSLVLSSSNDSGNFFSLWFCQIPKKESLNYFLTSPGFSVWSYRNQLWNTHHFLERLLQQPLAFLCVFHSHLTSSHTTKSRVICYFWQLSHLMLTFYLAPAT